MPFGENVGSAYVKLYADGDDVPNDIRDAMDELEPVMRQAGEDHADAYHKGFDKQSEKDSEKTRDKLYKNLQKGLGRMDAIGETMGSDLFDGLQLQLTKELDDSALAKLIRDKLEQDFDVTGSFTDLDNALKDINRHAVEGRREFDKLEEGIRNVINETDDLSNAAEEWGRKGKSAADDTWKAVHDLNIELGNSEENMGRVIREVDLANESSRTWTDGFRSRLHNLNVELDKSATLTGRIFGKGSRNDFFNIVGSMVEGITRIVYSAPNLLERLFGGGSGGGGAASVLKAVGGSLVGVAVAVSAVVIALGPIAALISGITAGVIALAGSLAFAASAVGIVGLALIGPFAAGLGVAALGLSNLDKQTKHVLSGLGDEFKKLGKSAGEALGPGIRKAAEIAKPAIAGLEPLIDRISRALGRVAVGWAEITESRAYKRFVADMTTFLPGQVEKLGTIIGNVGEGLMGFLRASEPLLDRFTTWLVDITDEFAKWSNSRRGQRELRDFFDRAGESAKVLGDTIEDITVLLAELLDQGKDTGDDLFTELGDKARELIDYLRDPKNREAIEDFFANGKQVAEDLGQAIIAIGDLIDGFDTEDTRKELHDILDLLTQVIEITGEVGGYVTHQWEIFTQALEGAWWVVKQIAWAAEETGKALVSAVKAPDRWLTSLKNKIADIEFGELANKARAGMTKVGRWFMDAGDTIKSSMRSAARSAGSAISGFVGDAIGQSSRLSAQMRARFSDIANSARDKAGDIGDWFSNLAGKIPGFFSGMAGKILTKMGDFDWSGFIKDPTATIVGWFSGLAGRILSAIGTIDIGSLIKVPNPGGGVPFVPGVATGGMFGKVTGGPQLRLVGEDGPEAIVPLNRPLSQVNSSVRDLSAYAQGLGGDGGRRVTVEEGAIKVYEVADGRATAVATLNELIARTA